MTNRISEEQNKKIEQLSSQLSSNQEKLQSTVTDMLKLYDNKLENISKRNEEQLEKIRNVVEVKMNSMQEDNNKKLDEMRGIVDTKLQETLNMRTLAHTKIPYVKYFFRLAYLIKPALIQNE